MTADGAHASGGLFTRRQAIAASASGVVGMAGVGSIWSFFGRAADDAKPAEVFKGDAPKTAVWEAWRARGWVKEASHYLKLDGNVQCKVCPNNCVLRPGDRSHCRN